MQEIHPVANRSEGSTGRAALFLLIAIVATMIDLTAFWLLSRSDFGPGQRLAIALMPLPGNITLLVLILRRIRQLDEFQKRVQFEAVTAGFLATGVAVFVYGYLEKAQAVGPLNVGFVWALMVLFYGIGYLVAAGHYKS
jgi:hypothetical protein